MGTVHQKTCNVLHDLIKINIDRVEGYTRASNEYKDNAAELERTFQNMIEQGTNFITSLNNLFTKYGGAVVDGKITMGKIYKIWRELQITFSGDDRKNIIEACEFGEEAAQRVYKMALEEYELGEEARSLIAKQKNSLLDSHDLIKSYCNRKKVHA